MPMPPTAATTTTTTTTINTTPRHSGATDTAQRRRYAATVPPHSPSSRSSVTVFGRVMCCLARSGVAPLEAWRACTATPVLASAAPMLVEDCLVRAAAALLLPGQHTIAALTGTLCPHRRAVLSGYALPLLLEPPPSQRPADDGAGEAARSLGLFRHCTTMQQLEGALRSTRMRPTLDLVTAAYHAQLSSGHQMLLLDLDAGLLTARLGSPVRGPFTFQFVRRERVSTTGTAPSPSSSSSSSSSSKDTNDAERSRISAPGERLRRTFVAFRDAQEALAFYSRWYALQLAAPPQSKVTLLECGTYNGTWRKWVLDIDASIEELEKNDFCTDPDELMPAVLRLGDGYAKWLVKLGCLSSPCPFAILSRHSPVKRSWHVTLCALADHERWREAMRTITARADPSHDDAWDLQRFVDPAIVRNSKSQYMQTLASTKVSPGKPCDCNCFVWQGLWASATEAIPVPEDSIELQYAATSVVMHDPWSMPFVKLMDPDASYVDLIEKVVKAHTDDDEDTPSRDTGKKRQSPGSSIVEGVGKRTASAHAQARQQQQEPRDGQLTSWDTLPPEGQWMRQFVEADGAWRRLTFIPSMANEDYWPQAARDILMQSASSSSLGAILVHAHIDPSPLCPKQLLVNGRMYCHSNDKGLIFCIRDGRSKLRLFMRCFSEKCRDHLLSAHHERCLPGGWVEIIEDDLTVVRLKQQPQQQPRPRLTRADEALVDLLLGENSSSSSTASSNAVWRSIPKSATGWMRRLVPGPMAVLPRTTPPVDLPPCLQPLFRLERATVLLHATQDVCLPVCPRQLAHLGIRRSHAVNIDAAAAATTTMILIIAQTDPRVPGTSHRLFVRCTHPDCAHLRAPKTTASWTELTKDNV
jgi:hypothetical protein